MKSSLFIECFICKNQFWKTHAILLSVARMFTSLPDNKIHLIFDKSAEGYCPLCWKNNLEDKVDVFIDAARQKYIDNIDDYKNTAVGEHEPLYMSFMTRSILKKMSTESLISNH